MLKKIVKSKLFPKVKIKQQLNDIVKQFYQDIQQMSQNYDYENLDNIYNKVINEIKNISDTDKHKELTNDFLNKVSVTYEIEKQKEKNLNDKFDFHF